MTRTRIRFLGGVAAALWFAFGSAPAVSAADAVAPISHAEAATLRAVPTFASCGLYLKGVASESEIVHPRYRKVGESTWREGLAFVYDARDKEYRGSVVGLAADTAYEAQVVNAGGAVLAAASFQTWSDNPPVAKTIDLAAVNPTGGAFTITESGTPEGWVRYTAAPGYVLKGGEGAQEALLLDKAQYILLDGLRIEGGTRHGIRLVNTASVRVRDCDISGFGRVGVQELGKDGKYYMPGDPKAINYDAGVYLDLAYRTVIERCYIHDPRNHANSWLYSHPAGPTGIFVRAKGETVIRDNDLIGSNPHRWNDAIEGYGNGNADGGFSTDADISGNYLAFSNDDGIELDGGQCNVRFYGNKIEGGLCGISTAPNRRGPCYVFGNLVVNLGDERGVASAGVKNGGGKAIGRGRTFFFNNLFFHNGNGIAAVGFGSDPDRSHFLATTRNNILAVTATGVSLSGGLPGSDFNHDFFTTPAGLPGDMGERGAHEAQGSVGEPLWQNPLAGDFRPRAQSPVLRGGAAVAGFTPEGSTLQGPLGAGEGVGLLPARDIPAEIDRLQLLLEAGRAPAATLTIRSRAKTDLPVRARLNRAFDWLRVTPQEATLPAGGTLTLEVSLRPDAVLPEGLTPGAVSLRLGAVGSIPVAVYARHDPAGFLRQYEAEALPGAQDFKTAEDAGASGGKCLQFAPEQARKVGSRKVVIEADLPAAGRYFLSYRVSCPLPLENHDSMFVVINGAEPKTVGVSPAERWHWVDYTGGTLQLPKGPCRIELLPREEIRLDAVMLTSRRFLPAETPAAVNAAGNR